MGLLKNNPSPEKVRGKYYNMNKKVLRKTPNWVKSIIILVLLVAIGYGIWFLVSRPLAKPPAEFLTARERGAEISQRIVELASSTNQQIKEINSLDLNGDYVKALGLIEEAKNKNQETLAQAVELANEVQKMTEVLDKIPSKSREIAIKAITSENYLLTNFMNYYDVFNNQFLSNLYKAIATSKSEYRQAAENSLSDLNIKAGTINNLNQQFIDQMREFDESFSR